jgi:hypothetical protein
MVVLAMLSPEIIDSKGNFKMHNHLRLKKTEKEPIAIEFWKLKSRWMCGHWIDGPDKNGNKQSQKAF